MDKAQIKYQNKIKILMFVTSFLLTTVIQAESSVNKLSDKLYTISGLGGNVAFYVDDQGILIIDSGYSPVYGDQILSLIREVSDKPIEYFVLTHYHPDHIRGAQKLIGNAKVIVHDNLLYNINKFGTKSLNNDINNRYPEYINDLKNQIENYTNENEIPLHDLKSSLLEAEQDLEQLKTIQLVKPNITFSENLTIKMDNEEIELFYLGPGHTSGNTIVYFKNSKIIHLGDLFFHGAYPYIDFEAGSNTENWINILEDVITWNIEFVIPGHGEICNKDDIQEQINYLKDLRKAVSDGINKGISLEVLKTEIDLKKYKDYNWPFYLTIGIEAVYNEITKK